MPQALALMLATASIGAGTIATKAAYRAGASPEAVLVCRFSVAAAAVVVAAALLHPPRSWRLPDAATLRVVAGAGAVLWVGWEAELQGLARLDAGPLIVLASSAPIWVVVLSALVWRTRPTRVEILAIAALLAGVAVMADPFGAAFTPLGCAAGLLTALATAVLMLILERTTRVAPATILAGALVVGCVLTLVAHPHATSAALDHPRALPYSALVGVAAVLWARLAGHGMATGTAVAATITFALEPLLVAIMAYILLGETPTAVQLAGGVVVVGAVMLSQRIGRAALARPRSDVANRQNGAI
jgi:drug/metabolite transporter (DMT)-like permease